jgi:hypothetical protein
MTDKNQENEQAADQDQPSAQESDNTSSSLPDDTIQAPQSGTFKKSNLSGMIPDDNLEAPQSGWKEFGEDFDAKNLESSDE